MKPTFKKFNEFDTSLRLTLLDMAKSKQRLYRIKCKERGYEDCVEWYFVYPRPKTEGEDWEIVYTLAECSYDIMKMQRMERMFIDLTKTRDTFEWAIVERLI